MDTPAFAPTVVIENFQPDLGASHYMVKRVVGEPLTVSADIFKDGHDVVEAVVKYRLQGSDEWAEVVMQPMFNDRWEATISLGEIGRWEWVIEAWEDTWKSWRKHFKAKFDAHDEELPVEAREGARLLEAAAARAKAVGGLDSSKELIKVAKQLRKGSLLELMPVLLSEALGTIMDRYPDRSKSTESGPRQVIVERELARFSAWYEFFPRSADGIADKHSTFRDCVPRLDDAKNMGFDVIYFPPIHPIGVSHRKGKNNTLVALDGDVGSPWAIGASTGGHRHTEPALGTVEDFVWLIGQAKERGLEIAMDFALNCSPDHPYVKEHPEWFHRREDGSIRYAENPPKKYQDIYPLNFHCDDWKALWAELTEVVRFWVDRGIKVFRVDNPHTKPVAFWEYLIGEIHAHDPSVIFLAEAFTKPRMMQVLGKIGYSQSYSYFTWRETKHELREYGEELTQTDMKWYYRANFWPNTPDILPHHLQHAGPAMFKIRAALAALMMPSWGMYSGYEFCENLPLPGREEYLDSEKYQITERDWSRPGIKGFLRELNRIRRENRALQLYDNLRFHHTDDEQVLAFSKCTEDRKNRILVIINLNPHAGAGGLARLNLPELGLAQGARFMVKDLLHHQSYEWQGADNGVLLDPNGVFMHVFEIQPL